MIIDDILGDEALRQREFPVTKHRTYLAHAAEAPLPARVTSAVKEYADRASICGQFEYLHKEVEEETRGQAAKLLGASPDEIAFIPCTSAGLNLVANGLEWKADDNVIVTDGDFPANIYPWLNLERLGVKVKHIPRRGDGAVGLVDVERQVDERTRLVSLSTVNFVTGATIDVDIIGQFLHEHGILFCLDAIQSLGALPCSVRHVDFLAADAHKWLLGPQGFGVLFVRRERLDQLQPSFVGWKTMRSPRDWHKVQNEFADTARRYEPGSLNILGLVGLHAALSLVIEVGISNIARRLMSLRTKLAKGLEQRNCSILWNPSTDLPTCITSFRHRNKDTAQLYDRLNEKRIVVSMRNDLAGGRCIRVSPHFYNTEPEIDLLLRSM